MYGAAARLLDPINHEPEIACGLIGAPLAPSPFDNQRVSIELMPAAYVTCTAICSGTIKAGLAHPPVPPSGSSGGAATAGSTSSSETSEESPPSSEEGKKQFELRLIEGFSVGLSGKIAGGSVESMLIEIRDVSTGERALYNLGVTSAGLSGGAKVDVEIKYNGEPITFEAPDDMDVTEFSGNLIKGKVEVDEPPVVFDVGDDVSEYLPDVIQDALDDLPDVDIPLIDIPQPKAGDVLIPGLGSINYIGRILGANAFEWGGIILLPNEFWKGPIFLPLPEGDSKQIGSAIEASAGKGDLTLIEKLPPVKKTETQKPTAGVVPPAPATITPFAVGSSSVRIHGQPALRWLKSDVAGCTVSPGFDPLLPKRTVFVGG